MTRVVLSGGGTAGHINPAIATAQELARRGVDVVFAGTPQGLENRLVPEAGFELKTFKATGFDKSHPLSMVKGISSILASTKDAKAWFAEIKPDAVVGFGAYVCIPVARAALAMHIPLVIHEQNSVMGMANRYLAPKAAVVCLTYSETSFDRSSVKAIEVTGNPVRTEVVEASRAAGRERWGIAEGERMLLIFGGSLGARSLNDAAIALKDELLGRRQWRMVQASGPKDYERVKDALALTAEEQRLWQLVPYDNAMGQTMAAADLIWSRAGASSLAEIAALKIPAVLIPYPYAREDHQTTNAKAFAAEGGALVFADDELASEDFRNALLNLIDDPSELEAMKEAAQGHPGAQAAARLADVVMDSLGRKS